MPDERVQAAIDHWAPRFTTMGVDYNDFVRATGGIERWAQWLGAWTAVADEHLELAEEAEVAGRGRTAGEAYLRAALCLHFGKFVWVLDGDRHRAATERAVAALRRAHAHLDPTAERVEASLGPGVLAGNLRRPSDARARPPLVVIIPGLDSTKEEFFHWENVFLARGMATLSMDGPGQGESGFRLPIRPDYEVAVAAMLDAVAGRDDLDLDQVGAVGVSLGGYYAPRAAAFEPRIRAVAAVSGPYNFGELWERLPPLTRETFVSKSGARDDEDGRARALELDLDGVMPRVAQPSLFVTGKLDRIIPWQQTERAAREASQADFVLYEHGTHVCSNVPYRYRPLVADWMWERLDRASRLNHLGEPVRRREDVRMLRGQARYLDDIELPRMAHAAFVRSPHAHAYITAIAVPTRAPGLLGVLTAADLAARAQPFALPRIEDALLAGAPHPILADDEVRYAGQPVAVVIAESRALAEDLRRARRGRVRAGRSGRRSPERPRGAAPVATSRRRRRRRVRRARRTSCAAITRSRGWWRRRWRPAG